MRKSVPIWSDAGNPPWSGFNFVTFFVTNFALYRKKLKTLFTYN